MVDKFMCKRCHKRKVQRDEQLCRCCLYQDTVSYTLDQEPDYQDWEFSVCEECGSTLDDCGDCPNTWCGNSPYQGENWY